MGKLQIIEGQAPKALETFRTIADAKAFQLTGFALVEHTLGHENESRQALEELIAQYASGPAFQIVMVYAWLGENDKAFASLDRAYAQHDGGMADIKVEPLFANLRPDPRYKALLRKLNLPE